MTAARKLLSLVALAYLCSAASCFGDGESDVPSDGACTGAEQCGTVADCPALCATVERLGCAAEWGIDTDDGACLDLCETASPGLCPALAATQTTCEDIDQATECGK